MQAAHPWHRDAAQHRRQQLLCSRHHIVELWAVGVARGGELLKRRDQAWVMVRVMVRVMGGVWLSGGELLERRDQAWRAARTLTYP